VNRKSPPPFSPSPPAARRRLRGAACGLAVLFAAVASAAPAAAAPAAASPGATAVPASLPQPDVAATLAECVVPALSGERSATFAAEMTALPGSARMQMRMEVQERQSGEVLFHAILAPGLGAWRTSEASVHVYKYLRQITNLTSPAVYRAFVHYRWLNARGAVIRRAERVTPRCAQPQSAPAPVQVYRPSRRPARVGVGLAARMDGP